MKMQSFMIYGATGYTGELAARMAVQKKMKPILAGRNRQKIEKLGSELNLDVRVFALDNLKTIEENIADCEFVLHCAGPFVDTAEPMAHACINTGTHYLDITGEIPVYQSLYLLNQKAIKKNTMVFPGAGFDIIPSDCLAASLKSKLPEADTLEIAFIGLGSGNISEGTAKSMLRQLPDGSMIRKNGKLEKIPLFSKNKKLQLSDKTYNLYSIPWGDVFTAFISTGIENITVYSAFSEFEANMARLGSFAFPAFKNEDILNAAEKVIETFIKNPDFKKRNESRCIFWGEATSRDGKKVSSVLETREGYSFTSESVLICAEKILAGDFRPGFQTPSTVYGPGLVYEISGTKDVLKSH